MTPYYQLYIYGAGGHGRVVQASAMHVDGVQFHGFIDDGDQKQTPSKVLSPADLQSMDRTFIVVIVGIGDNHARERIHTRLRREGINTVTVIDESAHIIGDLEWGGGIYVGPRAVINVDVQLDEGVIINTAAVVEHDCRIHAFAHIAPNATLCGGVQVGKRSLIGAGAVVLPKVKIGDDCIVGAGAVVTKDVPNNVTVVGNPARLIQSSGYPLEQHDDMTGDGTILA